jgi:small conductance mechanosensitive channel
VEEEIARVQEIYSLVVTYLVTYGFQLLGALLVFLLGYYLAGKVSRVLEAFLRRHRIDLTLSHFAAAAARLVILVMVAIIVLGKLGISVTPFVAAVGALSLGAGLALQGLLSNYGAGVSIILTRPFVVGDTISVQGVTGMVREVTLAYTLLSNEDAVLITIPNKHIVGEIIHNSSSDSIVESTLEIAYDSDVQLALQELAAAVRSVPGLSTQRAAQIGIQDFGANGFCIGLRYWVPTVRLFELRYQVNAAVHAALLRNGIALALPRREVHVQQG